MQVVSALMAILQQWSWPVLAALLGAVAAGSELISRYRDEPFLAIANRYGLLYLGLNGAVSLAAYGLLLRYDQVLLPAIQGDPLLLACAAGFGSMLILRSKVLTLRGEDGTEYPIGPTIVIETFLQLLDRKIDRIRASKRQQRVFDQLKDIERFDDAAAYLEASLLSFQNLSGQEKQEIAGVINQYRSTGWPESLKVMAVGFAFLTIAGEENFDLVISNLKNFISHASDQEATAVSYRLPRGE